MCPNQSIIPFHSCYQRHHRFHRHHILYCILCRKSSGPQPSYVSLLAKPKTAAAEPPRSKPIVLDPAKLFEPPVPTSHEHAGNGDGDGREDQNQTPNQPIPVQGVAAAAPTTATDAERRAPPTYEAATAPNATGDELVDMWQKLQMQNVQPPAMAYNPQLQHHPHPHPQAHPHNPYAAPAPPPMPTSADIHNAFSSMMSGNAPAFVPSQPPYPMPGKCVCVLNEIINSFAVL